MPVVSFKRKVVEVASVSLSLYILQRDRLNHASSDISGVSGTGKTATVHNVVKELKGMVENSVFDFFVPGIYISLYQSI